MSDQKRAVAAVAALIFALSTQIVAAQSDATQSGKPLGEAESSAMTPASGNTGAANNGAGTDGSLDHDAGKASSTVTGVGGGKTSFGAAKPSAGGEMETDPAQGGGKPH